MTITGGQLRAARAFLRWTAQDVADAAKLGVATVRRAELQDGPLSVTAANADAMRRALEAAGVEFHPRGGVFFTPREVVERVVDLIEPSPEGSKGLIDPIVGTGSFLSGEAKRGQKQRQG